MPLSLTTTRSTSASVVEVAAVPPSTMFSSAAVELMAVPLKSMASRYAVPSIYRSLNLHHLYNVYGVVGIWRKD